MKRAEVFFSSHGRLGSVEYFMELGPQWCWLLFYTIKKRAFYINTRPVYRLHYNLLMRCVVSSLPKTNKNNWF